MAESNDNLIIGTSAQDLNRDCEIMRRNVISNPGGIDAYLQFLTSWGRLFGPGSFRQALPHTRSLL